MPQPRYLTKSRYKLALECPRKLYYTGKEEYANNKSEDPFLMALADGGFQVGELAKQYFPGGIEITTRDKEEALAQTAALLQRDGVTIFEAAIRFEDLYVLVDILEKDGDRIELIEVKSKTWEAGAAIDDMLLKRGANAGLPNSGWAAYLNDIAFQHLVLSEALPGHTIHPFLMMVNKAAIAPTDGLNQKFRIVRDGRVSVRVADDLQPADLEPSILTRVDVTRVVERIHTHYPGPGGFDLGFRDEVMRLMQAYTDGEKLTTRPGGKCKSCEFTCTEEQRQAGLRDGFRECWSEMLGWREVDFEHGTVLDIWNSRKADELIGNGISSLMRVTPDDIRPSNAGASASPGLSRFERQSLQIEQAQDPDAVDYFDEQGFRQATRDWRYPLHFIDFETSSEALPFFAGSRPNDPVIFQYSHHVMHEDGRIEHAGQFLEATPGRYPSFELLRELKAELEQDDGTIFRYHNHENTCLAKLYEMLKRQRDSVPDAEALMDFIKSITHSTASSTDTWKGRRDMVDLCQLCEWFYLPVSAKGGVSLKVILPAILNGSQFLQQKYSQPIYGGPPGPGRISSLNFTEEPVAWVTMDDGRVVDPYKRLPPVFDGLSEEELERVESADLNHQIAEGGAAMMAYRRLQLTDVDDAERRAVERALLKYCELDTLAMVMLVEGWSTS